MSSSFYPRFSAYFSILHEGAKAANNEYRQPKGNAAINIDSLRLGSLIGPEIRPRHQGAILNISVDVTLGDLRKFLTVVMTPKGTRYVKLYPDLGRIFRTRRTQIQAKAALSRIDTMYARWLEGDRRSTRVNWLIPENLLATELSLNALGGEAFHGFIKKFEPTPLLKCLAKQAEPEQWLPFLSLELVLTLKKFTTTDLFAIKTLLAKATYKVTKMNVKGPWDANFPNYLRAVPLRCIWHFTPTLRSSRLITQLSAAHCTHLGHLAILHPEAMALIHSFERPAWTKVTRIMSC